MEEREKFIADLIDQSLTLKATGQQIEQFGYHLARIIPHEVKLNAAWFGTLSKQIDFLFKDFLEGLETENKENQ